MRLRSAAAAGLLIAAAAASLAAGRSTLGAEGRARELVVEDVARGRVLLRERVNAGDTFTLSYVHSSERVPVRGVFRIEDDGSLTVVETAFAGFGPGLPELKPGDDWTVRDGMIVARQPATALRELTVRVSPIARQRLRTPGASELDLAELIGEGGGVVRISAR